MSLFKKLTDFCAGIAAFVGGLFLLQKYMTFQPLDDKEYIEWISNELKYSSDATDKVTEAVTEAPSKLSQFFTPELINEYDYRLLAILVLTLAVSVIMGIIFKRLPYIPFFFSIIPAVEITYLFTKERLYTQVGLFLIAGALHVAGNIYECIVRDKEDGRHRVWVCAKISLLFPAAFCLLCTKIADKIPIEGVNDRIPIFKELAFKMTKPESIEIVTKLGWMFLIIFVIATVFYNVYFIDAILSAIPLIYTVHLLYSGNLPFNPALFTVLAAICFMTHIALCVCENNLSRKEQLKLKEKELASEN
jgi:hypothetical protein